MLQRIAAGNLFFTKSDTFYLCDNDKTPFYSSSAKAFLHENEYILKMDLHKHRSYNIDFQHKICYNNTKFTTKELQLCLEKHT